MFFASKRAWVRKAPAREESDDEDVIDETELQAGLAASAAPIIEESKLESSSGGGGGGSGLFGRFRSMFGGSASSSATGSAPSRHVRPHRPRRAAGAPVHRRHVDTNILSLDFGTLADGVALATGDPVFCGGSSCGAALSCNSLVRDHTGKVVSGPEPPAAPAPAPPAPVPTPAPVVAAAAPAAPEATSASASVGAPSEASTSAAPASAAPASAAPVPAGAGAGGSGPAAPPLSEGEMEWVCEFCKHRNVLMLDAEEIPTEESVDFVLEAAPSSAVVGAAGAGGTSPVAADTSLVVFCCDISGSMCVSTEVPGKHDLKNDASKKNASLRTGGDSRDQFMPGQRRDVTYISRLQAVQAAVTAQLEALRAANPDRRVALIAFNGEVTVYGDGTSEPKVLAGDRLTQYDHLVSAGMEYAVDSPVKDTMSSVISSVQKLEEGGPTALGPAVVVAVSMAARQSGSKVVLCTDGLANVGLGSLDEESEAAAATAADAGPDKDAATTTTPAEDFYKGIGDYAASKGVIIDIVGIEGDGCNLETLSTMAESTGGDVSYVSPLELTKNFASILAKPVVATNVSATMILHHAMQFQNEEDVTGNKLLREVGNCTSDTQMTFEYGVRPLSELAPGALDGISSLPFQVQVTFTKRDGMRVIRVITKTQEVTEDRAEAEADVAVPIIASHAVQQCAAFAKRGSYTRSRVNAQAYNRLLMRNVRSDADARGYQQWAADAVELDADLAEEEAEERAAGMGEASMAPASMARERKARRKGKDKFSAKLHGFKKASRAAYS